MALGVSCSSFGDLDVRTRNASTKNFSRPSVRDVHDVRVRLQGQRRARVTESAGHCSNIDAAGQHHRGGEMAEVMEADVCQSEVVAQSSEAGGGAAGTQWRKVVGR